METVIGITALEKNNTDNLQDVIYKVEYYLTVIENGSQRTEPMALTFRNPSADGFIEYNNLTEENIKSWIMNDPMYNRQIEIIRDMVFRESMTRVEQGFPWES